MRDCDKITTKEDRKQVKPGECNAIFNGMMKAIKLMKMEHSEWIPQLDDDIWDYILKICMQEWMVG